MGSPVSPIVANLYMEKFELKAINSFPGTPPANWFRYVDDTWCRLKKGLADSFFEHINKVDKHISFTQETSQDNTLPFLDAKLHVETDGHIEVEVYRKPTHTDQYLIFDSHHPLEQKLGVIRTLFHRADTLITSAEARAKEHTHLKKALSKCGYQQWTFNKALKPSDSSKKTSRNSQLDRTKTVNISIPYIQGVSEKIRRILHNYNIATNFKPCRTLRQMLFHPKDKLKNCVKSDVIYRLKCEDHQCKETYIGETSQPLKERYKQHCRASNSGFSSAIWHHLDKHKGHSFHLESTDILDREARWFERGDLFSDHSDLDIRYNLLDCHVSVCSPQVPQLFADNFDYQTRNDFIMGNQVHAHVVTDEYAARVSSPHMYDAVSKDILQRWTYPLVPDNRLSSQEQDSSYTLHRHHVYRGRDVFLDHDSVLEENVVIGPGTRIGSNTTISNSVIGRNCVIGQ
ncbi:hypothetical protein Bbelb_394070 [Branchiostoma belcheri]|nr:hypothetical protein Bbelb_394070 [Branchiostoma belcheri]